VNEITRYVVEFDDVAEMEAEDETFRLSSRLGPEFAAR
jgi:hypothetical protein